MLQNHLHYLRGGSTSFILNVPVLQMHIKYLMETVLTNYLTSSLDHNLSSEAQSCSAIQKILHLLWNIKFHYHVRKDPVLSQMTISHITIPIFKNLL
jgi:hypothetical protein